MSAFSSSLRYSALAICSALPIAVYAADLGIEQQQNQLQQQRDQLLRQQMLPETDVRLPTPEAIDSFSNANQSVYPAESAQSLTDAPAVVATSAFDDSLCFPIERVDLVGDQAPKFRFALRKALKQFGFHSGQCLNAADINRIMTIAQNIIIGRGYTTTRVLAQPQNLRSGRLNLTLLPGYVQSIQVSPQNASVTHSERIMAFQNEFPIHRRQILNLRDVEQGLENLKRLPTAEADIQIIPAQQPNESIVAVQWQQRTLPFRATLGLDDSGSKATGKWQGSVTLSADNPLGLSDMAYVSWGRALGNVPDLTDDSGHKIKGRTHNYAVHYSVPFGKWLWSFNHSHYRYHQAVAGYQQVYDYNGESDGSDIGFSRLLFRNAKRKIHFGAKLWQKETSSYINDAEVAVQRRKTAGWGIDFSHKEYLDEAVAQLRLAYQRGTGLNNALPAPEEAFGEGTSRMKIWTLDASLNLPFRIKKQRFAYDTRVHGQYNGTPLTAQDKMAIGGRYSVRGFDGEMSLSAERGLYWRNELSWQFLPIHQAYIAADVGRVAGDSAQYLLGQTLAGAAVGLRGQFKVGGALAYDVFASKALKKPEYFQTKRVVTGVNISWSF